MRNPLFSLQRRFALIFAAIFLIGGAVGYRFFVWYTDDVVQVLGQRLVERNALYEKGQVLALMGRELTLALKMASSPLLREWVVAKGDARRAGRALAELEDYRQFFRSKSYFFAIAESGNYYYHDEQASAAGGKGVPAPDKPRYTLSPRILKDGWFYATLRNVKDVQLNVDTDRHLGLTRVWINAVVRDREGRAVAVAGSGVDLSELIAEVIAHGDAHSQNLLLDEHGAIQAHRDTSLIDFASARKVETTEWRRTLESLLDTPADAQRLDAALRALRAGERDVSSLELSIKGRRQLVGIAWIPEIRWYVVALTEPGAVSSASRLPLGIVALAAALLLVVLVAALLVNRLVLSRIARLDRATAQMAEGRYALGLEDSSRDELGRLTRAFAGMAARVASYTDDLRRQVAERTAELVDLAHHDPLTGLLNRRGMNERLRGELNRLNRENRPFGLLQVDLDHFKQVNDNRGHAAGDAALVEVGRRLRQSVRDYDACARWGGEEFLVALFDVADEQELRTVAEKLRNTLRETPLTCQGASISLTCSIGAVLAQPGSDFDALLSAADAACYRAKAGGRDRVELAGPPGVRLSAG